MSRFFGWAGSAASVATFTTINASFAVDGEMGVNAVSCKPVTDNIGTAAILAAGVPFASGEIGLVAAGEGIGGLGDNILTGISAALGIGASYANIHY